MNVWDCEDDKKLNINVSGGEQADFGDRHCLAGLWDENNEKDRPKLFKWSKKKKREKTETRFLTLILEKKYCLITRECLSSFVAQLKSC